MTGTSRRGRRSRRPSRDPGSPIRKGRRRRRSPLSIPRHLRNKEVDPGDPPTAICERIVSLGADEFRKAIAKSRKEEEAKAIVEEADRVEPLDEKKEDGK